MEMDEEEMQLVEEGMQASMMKYDLNRRKSVRNFKVIEDVGTEDPIEAPASQTATMTDLEVLVTKVCYTFDFAEIVFPMNPSVCSVTCCSNSEPMQKLWCKYQGSLFGFAKKQTRKHLLVCTPRRQGSLSTISYLGAFFNARCLITCSWCTGVSVQVFYFKGGRARIYSLETPYR
jgi:hypothetical protein